MFYKNEKGITNPMQTTIFYTKQKNFEEKNLEVKANSFDVVVNNHCTIYLI